MGWKRIIGRLLLVAAGGGLLALVLFVLLPRLTEAPAPPQPPGTEAVVADVLNPPAPGEAGQGAPGDAAQQGGITAPSPLVAVRNNGEEVAVVFPAAGGEQAQDETLESDDRASGEEQETAQGAPAEGLPPVLSPEEVAAAMAGLEDTAGDDAENIVSAEAAVPTAGAAEEPASNTLSKGWRPEVVLAADPSGARHAQVTMPPPSATRDVQELLEALGYAPGPVDGIWGERTARAWRSFARDSAELAARPELAQLQPEENAEPPATVSPTPSGETVEPEGAGAGQAGDTRHPAGLPPQETAQPVVVPVTLRGVMGYRMPLVSRQGVPDQVVSGVLIPAHTTFVILKPGSWELVGLEPGEVQRLRDTSTMRKSAAEVNEGDGQPVRRGWNPLRLFRKRGSFGNRK